MLWQYSEIIDYGIRTKDGLVGTLGDLLVEDTSWAIRWAVIDTGTWLPERDVLLPPGMLWHRDAENGEFHVDIPRERIEQSPNLKADAPVSRQFEVETYGFYEWPPYWSNQYSYPEATLDADIQVSPIETGYPGSLRDSEPAVSEEPHGDPHLRSLNEVMGLSIEAPDGTIGYIEGYLIDGLDWVVRYLVVDAKHCEPEKMVLISPHWIERIDWDDRSAYLDISRHKVGQSPAYDLDTAIDRGYEERLFSHYGQAPYWTDGED